MLEASATKRDAKGYLQKYAAKKPNGKEAAKPDTEKEPQVVTTQSGPENVAVVMLREPQNLQDATIDGVAKTLAQLRSLGLLSTVVVDCGPNADRDLFEDESLRLCEAIESYGRPGAKLARDLFLGTASRDGKETGVVVTDGRQLHGSFEHDLIVVTPSLASPDELTTPRPINSYDTVLALTKFLTGSQADSTDSKSMPQKTSVERIILLDSLGGTPMAGRPGVCHRFINLQQEYDLLLSHLLGPSGSSLADNAQEAPSNNHAANLRLAMATLSQLPATASALITTPFAAANTGGPVASAPALTPTESSWSFGGMVTTRTKQNPLLHNLLTDKPMYSSSLPFQRISDGGYRLDTSDSTAATLVKQGMPLKIYPDPRVQPWQPPRPGGPRPRLTDTCVDLPRLVHLIDDSFGRKLDVEDYLNRVNENLAGIIITGEYEGGAILTWEKPEGLTEEEAYEQGRYVPYLDKFAVLKSRQGSGGVADIVFNAMVRDCFPDGVCWRSRKTNPVNKWYFERSTGTNKLSDSNWTMFWTTLGLNGKEQKLLDYESVCREVQPSWADNKHIVD